MTWWPGKAHVRVTGPTGGVWEGQAVACHDDPGIIIESSCGTRACLPTAFTITEIEAPDPPVIVAIRFSPAYTAARNAAQAVIAARYPGVDAHEAQRLATAATEAIYEGVHDALTEVPW